VPRSEAALSNPDRLSGLDASFLAFERGGAHMHVGSAIVFEGERPGYEEFVGKLEDRLHLVPRYRQKLAYVPLDAGRPVWVDDPHFNIGYHVRHTALPAPAGEEELKRLAGRVFSQRLDRSKPLWEIYLVDRLQLPDADEPAFALVAKNHHCLVDGVSGVDITTVLFDLEPEPPAADLAVEEQPWYPQPEPSRATLLADALAERASTPLDLARGAARALSAPTTAAAQAVSGLGGAALVAAAGVGAAPPSPFNVDIGPHRRFTWVVDRLDRFKAIKNALGGTVNDAVLAVVTGAIRRFYDDHAISTQDVTLRAMVPVSVRADEQRGALGNRVTTMYAPLPVHERNPAERLRIVHEAMAGLKESGQAVGAQVLTRLTDFAPPTILAQASRLQGRQRLFNLTVTNIPGPQFPLYMLGRRLAAMHPQVPLAANTGLGIAIMSYDGAMHFGVNADFDALPDVEGIADGLRASVDELVDIALATSPARPSRVR
jgi:diacylglycerol O-acyltransferase / wax synthase